jgi:transposase
MRGREPFNKEPSTVSITMIGLDTAKSVFQIHAVDETGKTLIRRKLGRTELIPFFEKQEACTVVMEACGASHHPTLFARIT